uniref:sensor histidine kinase n=1 Tax=Parerythrobacter lutipelagi TaxID=1964208 RepID=UPI0010F4613A|nr:histidine kinase [Parerythrobacter lutipelagi]
MRWMTPDRWRSLGIAALVQAVMWFLVIPLFDADVASVEFNELTSAKLARLDGPSDTALAQAAFDTIEPPQRICCDSGHYAARFTFDLEDVPTNGRGLIHELVADSFAIRLNGVLLDQIGALETSSIGTEGRSHRALIRIPASSLKQGENELVLVFAAKEGTLASVVSYPLIGDADALQRAFGHRLFLLNEYKFISMTIGYLVALLAFIAWFRGDRQPYLFWLGSLAALWGFGLHQQVWGTLPLPADWRALIMGIVYISLPLVWVMLIDSWGKRRVRYLGRIVAVLIPAFTLVSIASYLYQLENGEVMISAEIVVFIITAIGALGLTGILLSKLPEIERVMHWEFAIFLAMAVLILRELLIRIFGLDMLLALDYVLPVLIAALAAGFLSRNIRLFRSSAQINQLLQEQLDVRTAELAVAHDREKDLLREQAHQDERQRILRDMHDGLGSSLMSMMLAARRGRAEPEKVASGLQGVIDEMRLLIDSMDTVGESLNSALTLMRERARERIAAGGFALAWEDRSGGDLPEMAPRSVLQVFRILQEAMTNALKHSDGNLITVRVESGAISVIDNGSCLDGPRDGGRGLENMHGRAQAIGGGFDLFRQGENTVARIELPVTTGSHGTRHD